MTTSSPDPRSRISIMVIIAGATLGLIAGLLLRPAPSRLPDPSDQEPALGTVARNVLGEDYPAVAVACVTPGAKQSVVIGATPQDRFEIGSVSKALTGLLFADMIKTGDVRADARLGSLLPVHGPVAEVTLAQLATHRSGLTAQPLTLTTLRRNLWSSLTAANPYDQTVAELIDEVNGRKLTAPPGTYSNTGFELLGAALAAAAHRPYPELLTERILTPLGMSQTLVPVTDGELGDRDLTGQTASGRKADPWLGPAITPAGGVRSDVEDMAAFAQAALTGHTPGADALKPRADFEANEKIGWAWITTQRPATGDRPAQTITWHNGGTGGFNSFVGFDRATKTAVVVMVASSVDPSKITAGGFQLLQQLKGCQR